MAHALTYRNVTLHILRSHPQYYKCLFETLSGYSTTGSTILTDIESMPKGILFWRSATHWIGGMGIIVLTIAILTLLGIGGMQLFMAEAPGHQTNYTLESQIQQKDCGLSM